MEAWGLRFPTDGQTLLRIEPFLAQGGLSQASIPTGAGFVHESLAAKLNYGGKLR